MKSLNPTQYACLEAMGIDVWVSRKQAGLPEPDEISTVKSSVDIKAESFEYHPDIEVKNKDTATVQPQQTEADLPADWNGLQQAVTCCQKCVLHTSRTHTVFGSGNQNADWLIIGDKPSEVDDECGESFSDQSGELLTAMLKAIGLTRQQVYITNTLKCIPPNNREPEIDETETCLQYLFQQIKLIKPKLILVVGHSAAQRLLKTHSTMARLRQKVHTLEDVNLPVVVTYHPAYLLNMPADKAKAWQDLLLAKKTISTTAVL